MASVGPINGTKFGLYLANTLIGYGTASSVSISHSPRMTTNNTSGGYNSRMAGVLDWEMSCDYLMSMDGTPQNKYYQIFASYLNERSVLQVRFKSTESGDKGFEGYALVSELSISAPMEETATVSVSLIAAGPLTVITS
jgi:predicted secreted protein